MQVEKIPFPVTNSFTSFFLDYIGKHGQLKKFYGRFPGIENFSDQLKEKAASFPTEHREALVNILQQQYKNHTATDVVKNNIEALHSDKTFTVTTGHQLNIFTGPLYFIYKIVTVINSCKALKKAYPEYNFVPVYWMASEDHDFDEIKHFKLNGKKYTWESKQTGAVGRFNPKELETILKQLPDDLAVFQTAYLKHTTLSDAVRYYVNELFGPEGVVVIDADSKELKALFKTVIREDLFDHTPKKLIDNTNAELEKLGYAPQVNGRDINFFYLDGPVRARLEKEGDQFKVVDSALSFSKKQLEEMIESAPEKFSPNVILRPLYQEMILPNLAYVGGPSEIVYWLQLKDVFNQYHIPFPILMPRNFAMVMDAPTVRKFKKTGLELAELFFEKNYLFNHFAVKFSRNKIRLNGEKEVIEKYFQTIRQQAEAFDKTLGPMVGAETQRAIKSLEKIEHKLLRSEKRFQSDKLKQVEAVKDALFPNGSLQERTDNFLNFYQQDPHFIQKLLATFDAFDFRFNILMD
ncbi:MAG TPA: bacillithiol biosynthesis cysteine-adding enzyme BshC [Cyclobacteriaceae bacterium]|nr:bacillithiol biosynthesis cysteine-adding enzyme BshC [Cyclobacteriaceae bacterium]